MQLRPIRARSQGQQHGFIRRVVSPGDPISSLIKPFVFLDFIHGQVADGTGLGFHPHSGIATLTYSLDADIAYEDTTGQQGVVRATGVEWMRAGSGSWHRASIHPQGPTVTSFQLWLALPPGIETGPAEGCYVAPESLPQLGGVRVLLGRYQGSSAPIPTASPMLCLDVALAGGQHWRFQPPDGHDVAWAFVYRGRALVQAEPVDAALVALEAGDGAVAIEALSPCRLLLGSARHHPHPLVLGSHSVHTSREALLQGTAGIAAIGRRLQQEGRL